MKKKKEGKEEVDEEVDVQKADDALGPAWEVTQNYRDTGPIGRPANALYPTAEVFYPRPPQSFWVHDARGSVTQQIQVLPNKKEKKKKNKRRRVANGDPYRFS